MALLGKGALVIWHDPAPDAESDYNEWHSKEHMLERVGVPGFRRGFRYVALEGAPRYLNLYEVDELATLTSRPYLDRLNDPTPWTRRVVPQVHNNSRTLCRVIASAGSDFIVFKRTSSRRTRPAFDWQTRSGFVRKAWPRGTYRSLAAGRITSCMPRLRKNIS